MLAEVCAAVVVIPLAALTRGPRRIETRPMIAIDTLAYARRLREAGFSEEQAEAQAEALAAAMTDSLATKHDFRELALATKQDFRELELRTSAEFAAVRSEMAAQGAALRHEMREMEIRLVARMDTGFADLERRMTMRLGGIMVAGIGVITVLDGIL